jgi:hypothetical protein
MLAGYERPPTLKGTVTFAALPFPVQSGESYTKKVPLLKGTAALAPPAATVNQTAASRAPTRTLEPTLIRMSSDLPGGTRRPARQHSA